MFNIFKKKRNKNIQEWEYEVLKFIVEKLPSKYSFLKNQVNSNFILDSVPNEILGQGWKRVICDQNLYNLYKNSKVNYKLIGIEVFNLEIMEYQDVELDLYEGVLIGYKIEKEIPQFDIDKIKVENIEEKEYQNSDKEELEDILGNIEESVFSQLDIIDTFKIEIKEGEFYVIKDLGDGNYLSIDRKGSVYGMIHDPYEIEKIYDRKETFFHDLKLGNFSIDEYYNRKMNHNK